ncbi:MAG TPA: MBG domain-containing protein [Nocardioides sp.]|uniref:MBG domain-containing protein n=1 Tax=uncultured Nocardioides sp. TaxID=198441 RepID=UPI000EC568F8|nr:MBG domain-containing protein [uncultured Nocardioides sp.]HCB02837.1 hypothetical protein [Nocardioides sp.]HRI95664.1 MBG domain-containing protein [Nocardioides sp.]HRK45389.1 MBG domain-containing protein [Nocardioides sp.]
MSKITLARLLGALLAVLLLPFAQTFVVPQAAQAVEPYVTVGPTCRVGSTGPECDPIPAPPGLFNPGMLATLDPAIRAALEDIESQAVANTLQDHQLPASDRDAVLSWGRYDALAELWALVVDAFRTTPANRTATQQGVSDWMYSLISRQVRSIAVEAGAEYARWAGLNQWQYRYLADTGASESQLANFLQGGVEAQALDNSWGTKAAGYCNYKPPAPFAGEYDGSMVQTCFTPCRSPIGCQPPTPAFDQFQRWGRAVAEKNLEAQSYTEHGAAIATGVTFGAAVATSAITGTAFSLSMASHLTTTVISMLLPYTAADVTTGTVIGTAVPGAGGSAAAALGGAIAVVILAIVFATLQGIQVADAASLPGKLAKYVATAPGDLLDANAAHMLATTEGTQLVWSLFTGATLPMPRTDAACDNSLVPPSSWFSSTVDEFGFPMAKKVYTPLGNDGELIDFDQGTGCLNPPAIPPATSTDPQFRVLPSNGVGAGVLTPTITARTTPEVSGAVDQTVRLSGTWFVTTPPGGRTYQSLRLYYDDWDGKPQVAWLVRDGSGEYSFLGLEPGAAGIDPATCRANGSCWNRDHIDYISPDGQKYRASVEGYLAPVGTPSVVTTAPVVAQPVMLRANDFRPANSVGPITHSWRFQRTGCGFNNCFTNVLGPDNSPLPSYTTPVTGPQVTNTWQQAGTFKVELTATDSSGHSAVAVLPVKVGGVPPTVLLSPTCDIDGGEGCDKHTVPLGQQTFMSGKVTLPGLHENQAVKISWGDGTTDQGQAGPNVINFDDPSAPLQLLRDPDQPSFIGINAKHRYANAGVYYGTVSSTNWGGESATVSFTQMVTGRQAITFPTVGNQVYGDTVTMAATGTTASAEPVTYTASPSNVCQATGGFGAQIKLVGVGECRVTADQAGDAPVFTAAASQVRVFNVLKAPLRITPDDQQSAYGDQLAPLTATYTGLVNGDTQAAITGLVLSGPSANSAPGTYPISASGASSPNYQVSYGAPATYRIVRAELTVRVQDAERAYGAEDPAFDWTVEGLIGSDTQADITGIQIDAPAATVGVGSYPLRASGGTNPKYAYRFIDGTLTVRKAPLTITADDAQSRYGAASPDFTARYDGLVNGDTRTDISGLTLTGAPAGSDVGTYPVTGSGATNPNYDISYVAGTHTITRAPLTITADDKAVTYGQPLPALTATFDGLVDGDTESDVTGLVLSGPAAGAHVGAYAISPSSASSPNYAITYVPGTLRVTKAPLTITAEAKTTAYGTVPAYTWKGTGWVNGDTDATLGTPGRTRPTCTAKAGGVTVSATTAPGDYAGAITCAGAVDPNYTIGYAAGRLTINPRLSLAQSGLPAAVVKQAKVDGTTVTLPAAVTVSYGQSHSYSFPGTVTDSKGLMYVTTQPVFSGPVTSNVTVTATYKSMADVVKAGVTDKVTAAALVVAWTAIEVLVKANKIPAALTGLRAYAALVRSQSGKKIPAATATQLVAYAQVVYTGLGGSGTV